MKLTDAVLIELAICLAQYFYYGKDDPIMDDGSYDLLEKRYKKDEGLINVRDVPGNAENIFRWFERYDLRKINPLPIFSDSLPDNICHHSGIKLGKS